MAVRSNKRQQSQGKPGRKPSNVRRPSSDQSQGQSNALQPRPETLLQLQRQLGNRVVQRQIAGQQEDQNRPLSNKGLGLKMILEGHPYTHAVQREDEVVEEEAPPKPSVDVSIKLNKPQITKMSEKQVQVKHGKDNIAGYTKPGITVSVPTFKTQEIKVVVTLDFFMDLAKEYKGGRGQVLRDHEDAHILIAEKVAQEYVVGPLKEDLAEFTEFSQANAPEVQGKFGPRLEDFKTEEGNESEAFDDLDYPRMEEAYYGVATSLADLSSGSEEVKAMVTAMDAFNEGAKAAAGDAEALGTLTTAVNDAQEALGETNLARLQYNKEFKGKVTKAQGIVKKLLKKPDKLAEGVKDKLDEVAPILEKFTWQPVIE